MMQEIESLLATIKKLRSKDGCPWDRKQTHESLIPYLSEESAEAIEAILLKNPELIKEELGDVLLQILLHAEIASEREEFNFNEIAQALNEKMIRRHPHVFAQKVYKDDIEQKLDWEKIKATEHKDELKGLLDSVSMTLTGLSYAYKLQKKAASVGFDWDNIEGVKQKIEEEYREFEHELACGNQIKMEEEFGDLLFSLVNLSRHLNIDPERAIARTNLKFKERFHSIEKMIDKPLKEASLAELDYFWEMAKNKERL